MFERNQAAVIPALALSIALLGLAGSGIAHAEEPAEAPAVTAPSRADAPVRYKGVTTTVRAADEGFPTFNEDCHAAYPRTRMCTDQQIMNSFPAPAPGEDAWIVTTVVSVGTSSSRVLTSTGFELANSGAILNCNNGGYGLFSAASSSSETLYLAADGNFVEGRCDYELVVACCGR